MLALFRVGGEKFFVQGLSLLDEINGPAKANVMQSSIRLLNATHMLHLIMVVMKALNRRDQYERLRQIHIQSVAQGQQEVTTVLPTFEEALWSHPLPSCTSPWCHSLAAELHGQVITSHRDHQHRQKEQSSTTTRSDAAIRGGTYMLKHQQRQQQLPQQRAEERNPYLTPPIAPHLPVQTLMPSPKQNWEMGGACGFSPSKRQEQGIQPRLGMGYALQQVCHQQIPGSYCTLVDPSRILK